MRKFLIFCLPALFFSSCQKQHMNYVPYQKTVLDSAFTFSVDSSCIMVPNIFTPNGDGYNDLFMVVTKNIDSMSLYIYNDYNQMVYSSNLVGGVWDGTQSIIGSPSIFAGHYKYNVYCKTTSGINVIHAGKVYLCANVETNCISTEVPVMIGDMIDPNACGFIYGTAEMFCFE